MKFFSNRWSSTPIGGHPLITPSIFTVSPGVKTSLGHPRPEASVPTSSRFCREFFKPARKGFPVRGRTQALQDVDLVGVRADQDSRFTSLHTMKNARCGFFGRSAEEPLKLGGFLLETRSCYARSDARPPRDRRPDSAGVNAGDAHVAALEFVAQ